MIARTFEELEIWKKAREIVNYLDKEAALLRREACEYKNNSIVNL